ncbi:MAG: polysaccharide deacetylase family protein [Chloroflexi bacterium]|nr:polysaccharide deacetylase family protein [Chloroflexota bacterium]
MLALIGVLGASAQQSTPEASQALPRTIYGSEAALANNLLLTIDDCSDEQLTRQMVELLIANNVTATFFPNTIYINEQNPQLWRYMVGAGFEIGYHTRTHQEGMSVEELTADFARFQDEVRQLLGDNTYTIRLVRPPYGIWDNNWNAWTEANDLVTVRWNVVPRARLEMSYVEAVLNDMENGGRIILLHPRRFDLRWLEQRLPALLALTDAAGQPLRLTSVTEAFNDDDVG